jgi:hypothetical protein
MTESTENGLRSVSTSGRSGAVAWWPRLLLRSVMTAFVGRVRGRGVTSSTRIQDLPEATGTPTSPGRPSLQSTARRRGIQTTSGSESQPVMPASKPTPSTTLDGDKAMSTDSLIPTLDEMDWDEFWK